MFSVLVQYIHVQFLSRRSIFGLKLNFDSKTLKHFVSIILPCLMIQFREEATNYQSSCANRHITYVYVRGNLVP